MFEIGNSLHEARIRHGLDLRTAEVATKIRGKYLKALEEEQFDLLPAQTYVKGFLRSYADFLGLDGQLYVDEYNSRFVAGGDDEGRPLRPRRSNVRPQRRGGRLESNVVLVTLAAIGLVAALVIVAWKSGDSGRTVQPNLGGATASATTSGAKPAAPTSVHLVVSARTGNSRIEAHVNSAGGRLLFQGTLLQGKSVSLQAKRVWISVAEPRNVELRMNGQKLPIGRGVRDLTLLVTTSGVRRAPAD